MKGKIESSTGRIIGLVLRGWGISRGMVFTITQLTGINFYYESYTNFISEFFKQRG